MSRVIICGSRDWADPTPIEQVLLALAFKNRDLTIVTGGAKGADRIANGIARSLGLRTEVFPADWMGKGRGAGPIRNRQMLDSGADIVFAFKENFDQTLRRGGTENMVAIAERAGVRVVVIPEGRSVVAR